MIFLALWPPKSAHNIFWGIIKKKNLLKYLLLCKWQDSSLLNAGLTMYKMPPLNLRADCSQGPKTELGEITCTISMK